MSFNVPTTSVFPFYHLLSMTFLHDTYKNESCLFRYILCHRITLEKSWACVNHRPYFGHLAKEKKTKKKNFKKIHGLQTYEAGSAKILTSRVLAYKNISSLQLSIAPPSVTLIGFCGPKQMHMIVTILPCLEFLKFSLWCRYTFRAELKKRIGGRRKSAQTELSSSNFEIWIP